MYKPLTGLALCTVVMATPLTAQGDSWQHKWFWGAQASLIAFKQPPNTALLVSGAQPGWSTALAVGGHWLITGGKSALYVAYDHILFDQPDGASDTSAVVDRSSLTGIRDIEFSTGRRIQAHVYIFPLENYIQPYLGGGFSINQVTNGAPLAGDLATMTPSQIEGVFRSVDLLSTKAYPVFTGGLQLRLGRMAIFGHYQFMPQSQNFLLTSAQHVFGTGVRWSLTSSREEVTTRR